MVDKQREKFVQEIRRLEDAVERTESEYLKKDYTKAIRRMKRELREYDSYKLSNNKSML